MVVPVIVVGLFVVPIKVLADPEVLIFIGPRRDVVEEEFPMTVVAEPEALMVVAPRMEEVPVREKVVLGFPIDTFPVSLAVLRLRGG